VGTEEAHIKDYHQKEYIDIMHWRLTPEAEIRMIMI
jgi:hypothetical protein